MRSIDSLCHSPCASIILYYCTVQLALSLKYQTLSCSLVSTVTPKLPPVAERAPHSNHCIELEVGGRAAAADGLAGRQSLASHLPFFEFSLPRRVWRTGEVSRGTRSCNLCCAVWWRSIADSNWGRVEASVDLYVRGIIVGRIVRREVLLLQQVLVERSGVKMAETKPETKSSGGWNLDGIAAKLQSKADEVLRSTSSGTGTDENDSAAVGKREALRNVANIVKDQAGKGLESSKEYLSKVVEQVSAYASDASGTASTQFAGVKEKGLTHINAASETANTHYASVKTNLNKAIAQGQAQASTTDSGTTDRVS